MRSVWPITQGDVKFANAELQGGFVIRHEDIDAIVKAFGLAIFDYALANAFDEEPRTERESAWSGGGDSCGGHLAIGRGLTGPAAAFCAMAIGSDGIKPGDFGGMGRQG